MKFIVGIIKPFKLDDVKEALKGLGVQGLTVSARSRASAASAGTPRCTEAPSTRSTSCRRCGSRSSSTTPTPTASPRASSRPPAPARSATARSGSSRSSRLPHPHRRSRRRRVVDGRICRSRRGSLRSWEQPAAPPRLAPLARQSRVRRRFDHESAGGRQPASGGVAANPTRAQRAPAANPTKA